MVTRRKFIVTSGAVSSVVGLAGCSSGGQTSEENGDAEENEESTDETETDDAEDQGANALPNFSVEDISFTSGFSTGLKSTVVLRSRFEQGSGAKSVNLKMQAYNGETLVGESNEWQDIKPELTNEYELNIEDITEMSETSLDDITEIRILAKRSDEEYSSLRTFTGETVRERIDG